MTSIATQILETQRRKKIAAAFVKRAVGAGAYSSSPVWGGRGVSPAANPHAVSSGPQQPGFGSTVWNNGGKQTAQTAWNYAGKPALSGLWNTLSGIGTTAAGLANVGGGGVGNVVSGIGYGLGAASDAVGATNNAKGWVADNMWRHTNNAAQAGLKDTFGGLADLATMGGYDYDSSQAANPGLQPGTAVEQMRSGIRDELGRGSAYDLGFRGTNAVADFAAESAALGGIGRGLNVGAQAVKATPALNAASKVPVVGQTLEYLASAPTTNMFAQSLPQWLRASVGTPTVGSVVNTAVAAAGPGLGVRDALVNDIDRPRDRQMFETDQAIAGAQNQARRQDDSDYAMARAMMHDPAMQNRMTHLGLEQPLPQSELQKPVAAIYQTQGPEAAQQFIDEQAAKTDAQANAVGGLLAAEGNNGQPGANQQSAPAPQGTPYVDAITYADPAARQELYSRALAPLFDAKTPEQKAEVEKTVVPQLTEQMKAAVPPEQMQAVQAVAQDPTSPEARKTIETGRNNFATEQAGGDPTKLQDPEFFGRAMGMWDSLGAPGQMAVMLGVPAALIGVLSGNGLATLLGGLGLGFAGAAGGLFGSDAQMFAQGIGDYAQSALGSFFGGGQQPAAAAPAGTQPAAPAGTQPGAPQPTPAGQPAPQLNPQQTQLVAEAKQNPAAFAEKVQKDPATAVQLLKLPDATVLDLYRGLSPEQKQSLQAKLANPGAMANALYGNDIKRIQELIKKGAAIRAMRKAARCWAGYEPVPGKAPYSEDSCRPKTKKKPRKATNARKQQSGS